MLLEDYFDFLAPDDIRLKGSRVGLEHVLYEFIHRRRTPEEIVADTFPTLTLEQVYAAVLYYLHNKDAVHAYLTDWLEWSHRAREEQRLNPSPATRRLLRVRQALEDAGLTATDYAADPALRRRINDAVAQELAQAA